MAVSQFRYFASARGTFQESLLYKEGFVDLFEGPGIFAEGGSDSRESYRASFEFIDDGSKDTVVDFIESVMIDIQCFESMTSNLKVYETVTLDHREVAYSAEQGVGDTGSASGAEGDLARGIVRNSCPEQGCGPAYDSAEHIMVVIFQMAIDSEAGAKGSGQQSGAGRGTDEGEGGEGKLYGLGAGSFVEQDVDTVILHSGI